jgi:hypothetical protein
MSIKEVRAFDGNPIQFENLGSHNEFVKITGLSQEKTYLPLIEASEYITEAMIEVVHALPGQSLPHQPYSKIEELYASLHTLAKVDEDKLVLAPPAEVKAEEISHDNPFVVEFDPPESRQNPTLLVGGNRVTAIDAFGIGLAILSPKGGWNSANPPPERLTVLATSLKSEFDGAYRKAEDRGEVTRRSKPQG